MIKNLIKLALILIVGILVYNYFLGTPEEKKGAQKIFHEVKDVFVGVKDLVKSEKEKFDSGKYDKVVDEVGDLLDKLKRNAKDFDEKYLDRIDELEKKREKLRDALSEYEQEEGRKDELTSKGESDTSAIKKELQELLQETEDLLKDMEKQ